MLPIHNEPVYQRGKVIAKTDLDCTVELVGRNGFITVPWRMTIANNPVEIGDEIAVYLSFVEVYN